MLAHSLFRFVFRQNKEFDHEDRDRKKQPTVSLANCCFPWWQGNDKTLVVDARFLARVKATIIN